MKLTKEHIGKKMRLSCWDVHHFFIPLGQTSSGTWVGENETGSTVANPNFEFQDWKFFEEPEEEIKLWSVWESYEMPQNFVFVFYIDNENRNDLSICFIQNLKSGESCTVYFSKKGFLDKYKPRPDLEVVAPFIERESSDSKLIIPLGLNPNYINNNSASMRWDVYKWPASLALCQIVKKKK